MQIYGMRIGKTEDDTSQGIPCFVVLLHRIRYATSCILRPFNTVGIYLESILIVYLHAVTGKIRRISAVSRNDLFPNYALRHIPVRIQFHIINPA